MVIVSQGLDYDREVRHLFCFIATNRDCWVGVNMTTKSGFQRNYPAGTLPSDLQAIK
jgi:hypothetical protein